MLPGKEGRVPPLEYQITEQRTRGISSAGTLGLGGPSLPNPYRFSAAVTVEIRHVLLLLPTVLLASALVLVDDLMARRLGSVGPRPASLPPSALPSGTFPLARCRIQPFFLPSTSILLQAPAWGLKRCGRPSLQECATPEGASSSSETTTLASWWRPVQWSALGSSSQHCHLHA